MTAGVVVSGVFVGKELANRLYAEELIQDRFVIRKQTPDGGLQRLGEVCGSKTKFLASRPNGDLVATCSSLRKAALELTRI